MTFIYTEIDQIIDTPTMNIKTDGYNIVKIH